jgi:glycosyltransferase involved in cell wall biosynthesis
MQKPLVTVYITNHNYGRFIRESIESVLNQSFQDFELLIIDDGSTDNSREIIESYASNERIRIIYQKNQGLNRTNNIALRSSTGKYLMRLDADDFLDNNALLVLSAKLESDPKLSLVFPDYYLIDSAGDIIGIEKRNSFEHEVTLKDLPAHGACTMIRKSLLLEQDGYDESFTCQDGYDLWLKLTKNHPVANISTPLFYYRQHGSNLTRNESRILDTRARIKSKRLSQAQTNGLKVLGIIPIRNTDVPLVFEEIGGQKILDIKIQQCLVSEKLNQTVISSPSDEIKHFIEARYANESVIFIERDRNMARLNVDLKETYRYILQKINQSFDAILSMSIRFPFTSHSEIDEAIDTMNLFETDAIVSVRPDTSLFFHHDGTGMNPILNQEKFSRLERDALYRYAGGLNLFKLDFFREHEETIGGQTGHIVVNQKSAIEISSEFNLKLAKLLMESDEASFPYPGNS